MFEAIEMEVRATKAPRSPIATLVVFCTVRHCLAQLASPVFGIVERDTDRPSPQRWQRAGALISNMLLAAGRLDSSPWQPEHAQTMESAAHSCNRLRGFDACNQTVQAVGAERERVMDPHGPCN